MPQPVTVYRWDDAGAPQITNRTPAEIIDVLKKCLVDGYGTKTALGWTMPFEDAVNYKVVFRNSTASGGSGGYVQVRSSDGSNASNRSVLLTPAKSATDIDTLIQPGYIRPFGLTTNWTTWVLIGTPVGFYLIAGVVDRVIAAYQSSRDTSVFIGDLDSVLPADAGRFVVIAKPSNSGDILDTTASGSSDNLCVGQNNLLTNTAGGQSCKIYDADNYDDWASYSYGFTAPAAWSGFSTAIVGSDISKKRGLFMRPMLVKTGWSYTSDLNTTDRLGVLLNQSEIRPSIRGFPPGFVYEMVARYTTETWPIIEEINGQQHFLLCHSQGRYAGHWINMVEW